MGSGRSGLYKGTYGSRLAAGSAKLMNPTDDFNEYIAKRKDIDSNGYYDVIAHGTPLSIEIYHNGENIEINHRTLSKILKQNKEYKGGAIRLLSCNTGELTAGFAQNLANKLNVPVKAPSKILWADENGKYFVAGSKVINGSSTANLKDKGKFITFYPNRRKK